MWTLELFAVCLWDCNHLYLPPSQPPNDQSHVHQTTRSSSMKLLIWAGGGELCRKWQRSLTPSHPQRSSPTLRKQATCQNLHKKVYIYIHWKNCSLVNSTQCSSCSCWRWCCGRPVARFIESWGRSARNYVCLWDRWHTCMHACTLYIYSLMCLSWIPYSRKYWRELNMVVGPQIPVAKILVDLNLAVW